MKNNGKQHIFSEKNALNSDSGSNRQTQSMSELMRQLVRGQRQLEHTRCQFEILGKRYASLQKNFKKLEKKEAQARHLAHHDELTRLPNRTLLQDRFRQAVSLAKRHRKPLVLLMLDLDGFKFVNDELGHDSGDKLLLTVAERLTAGIRGADTVCRYGGDEFVIMLSEIESYETTTGFIAKIHGLMIQPYVIDGYEIRMTSSVGAAVYPEDGRTFEELMKRADFAMYCIKSGAHPVSIKALPGNVSRGPELGNFSPHPEH